MEFIGNLIIAIANVWLAWMVVMAIIEYYDDKRKEEARKKEENRNDGQ